MTSFDKWTLKQYEEKSAIERNYGIHNFFLITNQTATLFFFYSGNSLKNVKRPNPEESFRNWEKPNSWMRTWRAIWTGSRRRKSLITITTDRVRPALFHVVDHEVISVFSDKVRIPKCCDCCCLLHFVKRSGPIPSWVSMSLDMVSITNRTFCVKAVYQSVN